MDGANAQPAFVASDRAPTGLAPTGFNRAYGDVQRCIRHAWYRVRAYRELTEMERRDGNEIAARRWIAYRADALRNIRMLRSAVR